MDIVKQRKASLQASAENHKLAINKDLNKLADKTGKALGDTMLTIGILLSSLALYKFLKGKDGNKKSKNSNRLLKVVKQQLAVYILNEGRSKIVDYINSLDESKK